MTNNDSDLRARVEAVLHNWLMRGEYGYTHYEEIEAALDAAPTPTEDATRHTRLDGPCGPPYCLECSEAVQEYVGWPCSPDRLLKTAREVDAYYASYHGRAADTAAEEPRTEARRGSWGWRDRRTGQPVSQSSTRTREQAERELEGWRARDRKGGRPDLHDLMPHVEVYRIYPPEDRADRLSRDEEAGS